MQPVPTVPKQAAPSVPAGSVPNPRAPQELAIPPSLAPSGAIRQIPSGALQYPGETWDFGCAEDQFEPFSANGHRSREGSSERGRDFPGRRPLRRVLRESQSRGIPGRGSEEQRGLSRPRESRVRRRNRSERGARVSPGWNGDAISTPHEGQHSGSAGGRQPSRLRTVRRRCRQFRRSSGPHLHFDVLLPASRANGWRTREIGERAYIHVEPFATTSASSLWTQQTWNYATSSTITALMPELANPAGHTTTLACPHLAAPHAYDAGPNSPCLHQAHASGDPLMARCTHSQHGWHGVVPCTHWLHSERQVYVLNQPQYTPCVHQAHPNGHATQIPCLHPPVQQHPAGHPGPTVPCIHVVLRSTTVSAFTLPGPACDV